MRRPPAPLLLVGLAALVLSASSCDGGDGPAGGATVPTEAPSTAEVPPTTTVEQSFAIPDDPAKIDVAYANRVMAALKKVTGDLTRKIVATRRFDPQDLLYVEAAYAEEAVESQARGFVDIVTTPDSDLKHPPGDNVVNVLRVVGATRECLYVEATVDVSPAVAQDQPARHTFIELRAAGADSDPAGLNPTPWVEVAEDDSGRNPCR